MIVAVVLIPTTPPVTIPVADPTLATAELLLVHTPGVATSLSVVAEPEHTAVVPSIPVGNGLTVSTAVLIQPVDNNVYVMVTVVGVNTVPAVTRPVVDPIFAKDAELLLQVPPGVPSLNDVVNPAQTVSVPSIGLGNGLTVTIADMLQPVPIVYVICAVPATPPVTTPVLKTTLAVPDPGLLLQVPPPGVSLRVVVKPEHTLSVPDMAAGTVLTVTTAVLIQPVGMV